MGKEKEKFKFKNLDDVSSFLKICLYGKIGFDTLPAKKCFNPMTRTDCFAGLELLLAYIKETGVEGENNSDPL